MQQKSPHYCVQVGSYPVTWVNPLAGGDNPHRINITVTRFHQVHFVDKQRWWISAKVETQNVHNLLTN